MKQDQQRGQEFNKKYSLRQKGEKRNNLLTVGIPTYNRSSTIQKNVKELINAKAYHKIHILIIDDASNDDTFQRLTEICGGLPIKLIKNPVNLGYQGNFIKLFFECQTDYMVITSDDDPLLSMQIDKLKLFLIKYKPLFVSTNYYTSEKKLYRGSKKSYKIIPDEFFSACVHAPGLVYKVNESKKAINDIGNHINKPGQVYPQVLLASELYMRAGKGRGDCFWWEEPIVCQGENLPSGLGKYSYLPARWKQHKLFTEFFQERIEKAPSYKYKSTAMLLFRPKFLT
jgi:glycosyltransferase involved in cell wall biosynthesis